MVFSLFNQPSELYTPSFSVVDIVPLIIFGHFIVDGSQLILWPIVYTFAAHIDEGS